MSKKKPDRTLFDDLLQRPIQKIAAKAQVTDAASASNRRSAFDFSNQTSVLNIALSAAVPLWQMRIRELHERVGLDTFWRLLTEKAKHHGQFIAEHGDALMFREKGVSSEAFNCLAEGIAILSFLPGGVRIFGLSYEEKL